MPPASSLDVVVFCDHFSKPFRGGAERVAYETISRMKDADVAVLSGVGVAGGQGTQEIGGVEVRALRGWDLSRRLGVELVVALGLIPLAWRTIRSKRPDVVHVHGVHFFGSVVGALVARVHRIPVVTTCHLAGTAHLSGVVRRCTWLYEQTVARLVLRLSSTVIAVSAPVAAEVSRLGAGGRTTVIENGVDSQRFVPGAGDGESTLVTIAVLGRLAHNKGTLETASALLGLSQPFRAVFAGSGSLEDDLVAMTRSDDRIEVVGHLEAPEVLLSQADIAVRYSRTEGQSLAVLEAMASGCGVVVSDIAANRDLVDHGRTGLVVSLDATARLGEAIGLLLDDPDMRTDLGAAARDAAQQHDWDRVAEATRKVLAAAADG